MAACFTGGSCYQSTKRARLSLRRFLLRSQFLSLPCRTLYVYAASRVAVRMYSSVVVRLSHEAELPSSTISTSIFSHVMNMALTSSLSQLFFFDGEKIKTMAEDISGSTAVKDSICSLLGLDMVDRLKADLNLHQSREAKKYSSVEDQKFLEQVDKAIREENEQIAQLQNRYLDKAEELIAVTDRIQEIENELHAAGSAYADQRMSEQRKHSESESNMEAVVRQLRLECEGLFPLSLCPNITKQLAEQLTAEKIIKEHSTIATAITKMSDELKKNILKSKALGSENIQGIAAVIDKVADKQATLPKKYREAVILHDLSDQSSMRIQDWLKAAKKSAKNVQQLGGELEQLHRQQQNSSTVLARAPEQEALKPIVDKLNKASGEAGKIKAEQISINAGIHQHEFKKIELEREKQKLEAKVLAQKKFIEQTQLIKTTQKALDVYHKRLTQMKIDELQQTVADCFNHLVRKEDVLHSISIDPSTFKVTLHDRRGNAIPKEELSSGEKQIYAISILWGLAKTSGRPLPVIVDTPLGRLDSDHRRNLIQNYFPNAGHQVILLSTDTEVDENLYAELQPNISHCYHLIYDDEERYTEAKQEYFWKEKSYA